MFIKYPSLTNHYNVDHSYIDNLSMDVIVTEKLDGSNFSICAEPDGTYRFASRNKFVANTWNKLDELVPPYLLGYVIEASQDAGVPVNLFGEVFGNQIIPRMGYGHHEVRFYDLFVNQEPIPLHWTREIFSDWELEQWFVRSRKMTLEDALAIDVENVKSEFSKQFAEGIVIRPERETKFNSRVFGIKKKRKAFLEKASKIKKEKSVDVDPLLEEFKSYLNENRIISVFSKHEIIDIKMTGDLIKEVIEDAMTDFLLDRSLDEIEQRALYKASGNVVAPLILKKIRV